MLRLPARRRVGTHNSLATTHLRVNYVSKLTRTKLLTRYVSKLRLRDKLSNF